MVFTKAIGYIIDYFLVGAGIGLGLLRKRFRK